MERFEVQEEVFLLEEGKEFLEKFFEFLSSPEESRSVPEIKIVDMYTHLLKIIALLNKEECQSFYNALNDKHRRLMVLFQMKKEILPLSFQEFICSLFLAIGYRAGAVGSEMI